MILKQNYHFCMFESQQRQILYEKDFRNYEKILIFPDGLV
jgi:hypothetical protein